MAVCSSDLAWNGLRGVFCRNSCYVVEGRSVYHLPLVLLQGMEGGEVTDLQPKVW